LEFGKDRIDSTQEIIDIANIVADFYLTDEQAEPFIEPNSGYIRQLEKAKNNLANNKKRGESTPRPVLLNDFKTAVDNYNSALQKLREQGSLAENLDDKHALPFNMVKLILNQVYERAVSPKVDLLRQYENGGDNVYGELLPKLVDQVLTETELKSDKVFVDLGSGVGNVVLQAALEFGCESWGCEMMENACTLADAQKREFSARCRLWGIATGKVHLEKGDFLENHKIHATMKRADVILVNNQAFTSQLNQALVNLFLDLKDGCKIISLKPFVPKYHEITERNSNDPVNNLKVINEGHYYSDSVSWTGERGVYYITEKDATRRHLNI
jgi:H3 lysine-79-specific histone-lysine N-methyltransferase